MIITEKGQEEDLASGNILFLDGSNGYEGNIVYTKKETL